MQLTTLQFFSSSKSDHLDVILPGQSNGIDTSENSQRLIGLSREKNYSVLAFNYPHHDRGDKKFSEGLKDELELLIYYLSVFKADEYKSIRFIGKSLGGILASKYLNNASQMDKYSFVIMGFIVGEVVLDCFTGPVKIIQGEKDMFGGISDVKEAMKMNVSTDLSLHEIKNADHSYNDVDGGKDHLDEVMEIIYD